MRYKKPELDFANAQGARFSRALAAATMAAREDRRLTGLDKIREPLAWRAALKACGFSEGETPISGFSVPASAGPEIAEMQEIADQVFAAAAAAAAAAEAAA